MFCSCHFHQLTYKPNAKAAFPSQAVMPALGTAVISSSQFNQRRGHNSSETKRQNMQFSLQHFIPAILLVGFFSLFYFFFPQLASLTFTSELEGWLSPAAHKTHSQMSQPGLAFLLKTCNF